MFRCLIVIAFAATLCAAQRQCPSTASDGDVESPTVYASGEVSTVSDPAGDALFNAPGFQDVVRGQVTKTADGDFALLMELAGDVPLDPDLPHPGSKEIWWMWVFDLDPAADPQGTPFGTGGKAVGRRPEFMVYVSWDGAEFAGVAIDRRPLLIGGEAIVTPVDFSINGKFVEAVLPSDLIGAVPDTFQWGPFTVDWSGPIGSEGDQFVDRAETTFGP